MKKISLTFLVLLSLVLGSAYVSAQGIEVDGDLTFSSFTNWNNNTYTSLLKNIKGEINFTPNINVFASFSLAKHKRTVLRITTYPN